jgi:hypothetical protein
VVIPHHNGQVEPVLLRGCEAYDPDFVVTYSATFEDVEHFNPGCIQMNGEDGEPLTGADRQQQLKMVYNQDVPSGLDEAARNQIVAACSSYRCKPMGTKWHEDVMSLDEEPGGHFANVLDMPNSLQGSVLACPAGWGGALGAAVAAYAGVAQSPSRDAGEPQLDDSVRKQLASWLLVLPGSSAPDELICPPQVAVWWTSSAGRPQPKSSPSSYAHYNSPALQRPVELAPSPGVSFHPPLTGAAHQHFQTCEHSAGCG